MASESLTQHLAEHLRSRDDFISWGGEEAVVRLAYSTYVLRTARGMTQEELAGDVGTAQPNISNIEAGDSNPTLKTIGRLAAALGVDLCDVLRRDPERVIDEDEGWFETGARTVTASTAAAAAVADTRTGTPAEPAWAA